MILSFVDNIIRLQTMKALMHVFEANRAGYTLLETRISNEVDDASDEGTLFRANSMAAKLFANYVRMTSLQYLWLTLVTSVNTINDNAIEAFGAVGEGFWIHTLRSPSIDTNRR